MIPFNKPDITGKELDYISDALAGGHSASSGPFTRRAVELLTEATGGRDVLLTTSCTDALEMVAMLLDIEPGDVVIVPSFTFVSTALAFVRQGASVRFCDIEPERLAMDPAALADLMDESVRAVVPVHYGGVGCRIDELLDVIAPYEQCSLVEDNAHGLYGRLDDRLLGSFGRMSTLSFHETKNFICGEGGALVLNDEADAERAHIIHDKGTNRRQFLLGQVDKYSWHDTGSSFGMSDLLAAFLVAQLEAKDRVLNARRQITQWYDEALGPAFAAGRLERPAIPPGVQSAYHMYYVLLRDRAERDAALTALREAGVLATFHYVPLHSSKGGRRFTDRPTECPVTDEISGRLLRLPFYNSLTAPELETVAGALMSFLSSRAGATVS